MRILLAIFFVLQTLVCSQSFSKTGSSLKSLKASYTRPQKIPYPNNNPYTKAKEKLGEMLFFDPRLSRSKAMSCATCHNPSFLWSDGLSKGVGDFHKELARKTPTVMNLAWDTSFFWDGRAETLEDQALAPIESKAEMGLPLNIMIGDINNLKEYALYFKAAFPFDENPINKTNVAKAIATFERSLVSGDSPFDRWIQGDETAISHDAKQGFILFNKKANCAVCHSGWNFTDGSFHDIGINDSDLGRYHILNLKSMKHAFKTPGLRDIADRFPYMHNGSLETLEDVIDHYDSQFIQRETLSSEIKPLHLTLQEKRQLISFLKTLTQSSPSVVTVPLLPR